MELKEKIIVALDVPTLRQALELVGQLKDLVGCFKVGSELLTAEGSSNVVNVITAKGGRIFYDGKFMDIPNTVAGAARAVTRLGVKMFNVHCLGGVEMMKAARKAVDDETQKLLQEPGVPQKPLILGVTILTSLDYYNDLEKMGFWEKKISLEDTDKDRLTRIVVRLALLAKDSGLDGVIASPKEIGVIREACGKDFLIVTPGVRPEWAAAGDQKRVMTPAEAIKAGADYLVIGRPITKPPQEIGGPVEAAKRIAEEIATAIK